MPRRFSRPPVIGKNSKAPVNSRLDDGVPESVLAFKATYVFERSMLDRFRNGSKAGYTPAPSLDGKTIWDTPEVKASKNAWIDAYEKISKKFTRSSPTQYVRILFKVLHGSSVPAPTVSQLASPHMLCYVEDYLEDFVVDMQQQFVAQSQRAKTSIDVRSKGNKQHMGLAIYSAILDNAVPLTALYRYCLAVKAGSSLKDQDWSDKFKALAAEYEFAAAVEYTLFPVEYSQVWGKVIPEKFKQNAEKLIAEAVVELSSKKERRNNGCRART